MTPRKSVLLLIPGLLWMSVATTTVSDTSTPRVNCYIVNYEQVNCTWDPEDRKANISFSYRITGGRYLRCPSYHYGDGYRIGCIFPFERDSRFQSMDTLLTTGGKQVEQPHALSYDVKLHPPKNVTLLWDSSARRLTVRWSHQVPLKQHCIKNIVSYQTGSNGIWQSTNELQLTQSYTLPQVSLSKRYTFLVKSSITSSCGESTLWSDWSEAVHFGPVQSTNTTGGSVQPQTSSDHTFVYIIGLVLLLVLIVMVIMLKECERIKVVFVPVVPDPTRRMKDLLNENSGNVERWLQIPPGLTDGFEPDFTEPIYPVQDAPAH